MSAVPPNSESASAPMNVLVWDEYPPHAPVELYPDGIRGTVAAGLHELDRDGLLRVRAAGLNEPDQGVPDSTLNDTDVLIWWGHARHDEVSDELAARVAERVRKGGMGFIALHSAHYSKTFKAVLDCSGDLKGGWREAEPADVERIRVCAPEHPIATDVTDFELEQEEMYGAPFGVPPAEVVVYQSFFPLGNEYFPSGLCWTVGEGIDPEFRSGPGKGVGQGQGVGRVFYFRPGHEAFRTYEHPMVKRALYNAVLWAGHKL